MYQRQDKTRQDKTRQDKTRQDKTLLYKNSLKSILFSGLLGCGFLGTGFVGEVYGSNIKLQEQIEVSTESILEEIGFENTNIISKQQNFFYEGWVSSNKEQTIFYIPNSISKKIHFKDNTLQHAKSTKEEKFLRIEIESSPTVFRIIKKQIIHWYELKNLQNWSTIDDSQANDLANHLIKVIDTPISLTKVQPGSVVSLFFFKIDDSTSLKIALFHNSEEMLFQVYKNKQVEYEDPRSWLRTK